MAPARDKPSADRPITENLGLATALKTRLLQGPDDVLAQLQGPQARLELRIQLEPAADPLRQPQPQRLEPTKPAPRERRPGVVDPDAIIDASPNGTAGVVSGPATAPIHPRES